ncbi:2-dehydro-3-deoxyphosphooctonate aldolase [Pseudoruegeria aquimaris]|uniref:2-dehydro-3-deoxyphosphooctonate aldolase n=1 Tax=Pseudoruegeria aquimaris TaxID=393663 RepID=A0A1Y5RLC4_9RHOB|nr:3-deoxy-8-phosphooctulonate synthase [Pseudoruegeria aquimaris]SLN19051.1 2-dehydro-3-deoxyphosphooctonate aldolase [Pseudoruegeria aquimaris]
MSETAQTVTLGDVAISNTLPFSLISGPCQLESLEHARMLAGTLSELCAARGIPYVFKASYDKANRSSLSGKRGLGMEAGLDILAAIREEFGCPVLTDVHEPGQCARAAQAVDILQIPAFLCRQTDLLLAAGETGAVINVKKGQFLAPWDVPNIVDKIKSTGNGKILLTERGASFGYNMLVSDMRALPIMAQTGCPVIFDATHSVQLPGGLGSSTGGQREFVPPLARAAVAVGVGGVFIETHEEPARSPSDGPNMVPLAEMGALLDQLKALDDVVKA